jgi:hypothetical protein
MPLYLGVRVPIEDEKGHLVGWVVWDDLDERVETADESGTLPVKFQLVWPSTAEKPTAKMGFRVRDGYVECSGVSLEAKPGGPEVTPADIDTVARGLRGWGLHTAISLLQGSQGELPCYDADVPTQGAADKAPRKPKNRRPRQPKITDDMLAEIARVYSAHLKEGPWKAIQDRFRVSESTAGRYVLLARKAGYLPATTAGKKQA